MSTSMERYVFFNNGADREGVRRAAVVAAACGARVVEWLPKAILMDVDADSVPDIAALLTDWQFTPDRRQLRARSPMPALRVATVEPVALAAA